MIKTARPILVKAKIRSTARYAGSKSLRLAPGTLPKQPCPSLADTALAHNICERIRARLPGRVRCLTVQVTETGVTLTGQCNTYYSKQLAQHVAMGALDYQRLVNNIDVLAAR